MVDLVFIQNNRPVTDSLTVAEAFEKNHADVLRDIRNLGCSEFFRLSNFAESHYVNHQGRKMPRYILTEQGFTLLAMGYTGPRAMEFKERYIAEFERMRTVIDQQQRVPKSSAEMLLMMAQQFVEQEKRVQQLEVQLQVTKHRIDNLDHVDVIGDKQQRLGAMVKKIAQQNGWTFQKAWREFTSAFNTAYRTNLTQRMEHYKEKHGLKDLSRPQYLSMVDQLDDAIRVADKMLNQVLVGV